VFDFCPKKSRNPAAVAASMVTHAALISAALLIHSAATSPEVTRYRAARLYIPPLAIPHAPEVRRRITAPLRSFSREPATAFVLPAAPAVHAVLKDSPPLPGFAPTAAPDLTLNVRSLPAEPLPPAPEVRLQPARFAAAEARTAPAAPSTILPSGFDAPGPVRTGAGRIPVHTGSFGDSSTAVPERIAARRGTIGGFAEAEVAAGVSSAGAVARPAGGFETVTASRSAREPSPSARLPRNRDVIEILFKPRPSYTDEARRLGIEGDVLLDTWFGANGQVRVERVLRGLGHGLDESAIRAAAGIRFRPATAGGLAVDIRATVHIEFQLAN